MALSRYDRFTRRLPSTMQPLAAAGRLLWDEWLIYIVFNLMWTLSMLTILFGPPLTFGLFYVAQRSVEGRVVSWRHLLQGARRHFWQSWLWMAADLLIVAMVGYALIFYQAVPYNWARGAQAIMAAVLVGWLTLQLYALPLLMVQPGISLRSAWFLAWRTILRRPLPALIVALTVVSFAILIVVTQGLGYILLGPGFVALLSCRSVAERSNG